MREDVTRHAARARLRELIAASRVGDRLPSERQLSERWGAARMTIRRATDGLIAEGLVERRQGSGTYVMPQPFARLLGLTSFTQDMCERGLVPGSKLLAFRVSPADGPVAGTLNIAVGEPALRFTRLRLANAEPMAVETVSIPAAYVPGLAPADLDGSLYELLAARYGMVTGSASVRIEPVLPDSPTCELLAIASDQPCLRLWMVDRDARGRVIMAADCIYRGDRYQLSAEITGAAFPSAPGRRQR
ncbi:MAG: GntR family transcriptional regulator [Chloroflexi bacterium]|nr:GntR family transcriptional regulator [Chloroflexota bacterium]